MPSPSDVLLAYGPEGASLLPTPEEEAARRVPTFGEVLSAASRANAERLLQDPMAGNPMRALANFGYGIYEDFGNLAKRMTEASARQEIDPSAGLQMGLNLAGMGMPFAAKGAAGVFGGRIGAQRLADAGKPEYLEAIRKAEDLLRAGVGRDEIYARTSINGGPGISFGPTMEPMFELPGYGTGFKQQAVTHLMPETVGGTGI